MRSHMTIAECMKTLGVQSAARLLGALLLIDTIFILLHFVHFLTPFLTDERFNVSADRGYPEYFQYAKYIVVILLLLRLSVLERSANYVPFVLLFFYFLLDDSMKIHENGGLFMADALDFPSVFGLRPRDLGELAISAIAGVPIATGLAWAHVRGSRTYRKFALNVFILVGVLLFFGIGLDMVDIVIAPNHSWSVVLKAVEDGGEMLAVSLIVWYAYLADYQRTSAGSRSEPVGS